MLGVRFVLALDGGASPTREHKSLVKAIAQAVELTHKTGKRCRVLMQIGMTFPMGGQVRGTPLPKRILYKSFVEGKETWFQ